MRCLTQWLLATQANPSLGLSRIRGSFSASFDFWTAWGLLLMRNRFSGMGGISSGRTVDVTSSSCSFSSALSASTLGQTLQLRLAALSIAYTTGRLKYEQELKYLFFSFFLRFFCFFVFFFFFFDSFSESSESEEESDELSESLELLELEEACSRFFSPFFAATI